MSGLPANWISWPAPATQDAAESIGIGTATLLRWMKDPEFDAACREARRATFSQSIAGLQQMFGAAATLGKVMVDPNTPASTKGARGGQHPRPCRQGN